MSTCLPQRLCVFAAIVAVFTALGTGSATADTTMLFGGTDNPYATDMQHSMNGTVVSPGSTVVHVWTPEEFSPASGSMSYDDSRDIGQDLLAQEMASTPGDKHIVAYSQSASFVSQEMDDMNQEGTLDHDSVDLVLIANPRTPRSGIESKLAGVTMTGITPMGPTIDTGVTTVAPCRQYDPICDFPDQLNLVTAANALAGYKLLHPNYSDLDMSNARYDQVGNTTYVTVPTLTPPLVQMARDAGFAVSAADELAVESMVHQSDPGPGNHSFDQPIVPVAPTVVTPAPVYTAAATTAPVTQQVSQSIDAAAIAVKMAVAPDLAPAVDSFVASVQSSPIVGLLNGLPPLPFG